LIYLFAREGKIDLNMDLTIKNKSAIYTDNFEIINISIIEAKSKINKSSLKQVMITLGELG